MCSPEKPYRIISVQSVMFRILSLIFFLQVSISVHAADLDSLISVHDKLPSGEDKVNLELSIARNLWSNDLPTTKSYLTQALELSRSINYTEGEAKSLLMLGKLKLNSFSPYDEVTTLVLASLKKFELIEDSSGIAECLLQLGVVNYSLNSFENSSKLLIQCISTSPVRSKLVPTARYLLGLCYSEMGRYDEAHELLKMSMTDYAIGNEEREILVEGFIGKLLCNQGKYHESITKLETALETHKEFDDSTIHSPIHAFLSTAYLKIGNMDKVVVHAEYAVINNNLSSGVIYFLEAAGNLHQAYALTGNMTDAYETLLKWQIVSDSISSAKIMQRISNQKAQYDFDKEMMEEKAKQELDKEITSQEMRRQKLLIIVFVVGFIGVLIVSVIIFRQRIKISKEKAQSEKLLLNILPEDVAQDLKVNGKAEAKSFSEVSILFTDFKEFTQKASKMNPVELVSVINTYFEAFDYICEKYDIEKIKTIGDAYMAVGGLTEHSEDSVERTVLAAIEMQEFITSLQGENKANGEHVFEMRVGIHTGPVVAGIVGVKKFQYDVWGDTVNTASRMETECDIGKVNISGDTYKLIKNNPLFAFDKRGKVRAKGKGEMDMYFVQRTS
jgi:adenylate cyclase